MERTPQDFVEDMLSRGRDWIAITAVASVVRDGRWKDPVRVILQERGLMPKDDKEIVRLKIAASKKVVAEPPRYMLHKTTKPAEVK